MLLVGQQSTFPKILFIRNRMKIERLIDEGLMLGGSGMANPADIGVANNGGIDMHGRALEYSEEPTTDDEGDDPHRLQKGNRSPSIIQELKRQSGVFFDDSEVDSDGSEDEGALQPENGYGKGQ